MAKFGSKESLLALATFTFTEVEAGGQTIRIRSWPIAVLDQYQRELMQAQAMDSMPDNFAAKLLVWSAVDDDGEPLFSMSDLDVVGNLPADIVSKVAEASIKHNTASLIEKKGKR